MYKITTKTSECGFCKGRFVECDEWVLVRLSNFFFRVSGRRVGGVLVVFPSFLGDAPNDSAIIVLVRVSGG